LQKESLLKFQKTYRMTTAITGNSSDCNIMIALSWRCSDCV